MSDRQRHTIWRLFVWKMCWLTNRTTSPHTESIPESWIFHPRRPLPTSNPSVRAGSDYQCMKRARTGHTTATEKNTNFLTCFIDMICFYKKWKGTSNPSLKEEKRRNSYRQWQISSVKGLSRVKVVVCWLLNVPATCKCISGTDLLRQFYVLPHWDRSCRSNSPSHLVTAYWHRADQSQCWPYNARRLTR